MVIFKNIFELFCTKNESILKSLARCDLSVLENTMNFPFVSLPGESFTLHSK